ncbi:MULTISPECIES: PIN domain-containing protein [Methylobacterium]|uniref:tRNA(fMet)-specific endonuclease VapC n=1 Tax=Methylobacterium thuringiense TaxID=1003091 RepID=A0ABQ4TIR0_9HYPH|nr:MULTISPECIES: PIN domain-containing protein [Methylobacterium]GJE54094.1 tRNA(fMet)-specific endonuclease VapC [Methylobacterium thuringiense]
MTTDLVFVDTNVLIYARDARNSDKMCCAQAWVLALGARSTARINLQILNELTRWILKNEARRSTEEVQEEMASLAVWGDRPLTQDEVEIAWAVRARLGYQWFDCLLLAAAVVHGCRYLLTEDMAHEAIFESVTLINPFRTSPDELFLRN